MSWNWPAFFVAFCWGLYRRMYGSSFLYCLAVPACLAVGLTVVFALIHRPPVVAVWDAVLLVYGWILVPLFANPMYHRSILRRIRAVRAQVDDPAVQLVILGNGPHSNNFVAVAFLVAMLLMMPTLGILAGIAVPAYRNYTIRTQVAEGLRLSVPIESAIASAYAAQGSWPRDLSTLNAPLITRGQYVEQIEVWNGTIHIRYGEHANRLISGQQLALTPALAHNDVIWNCGGSATTVPARFLPKMCRR